MSNIITSVIIPARNEIYLEQTIKNVIENAEGEIEIIAVLDGYLPEPPITVNPGPGQSVRWIHNETAIGQRQSINKAAREARGKYIMKLDAHCAVDKGFDVKLAADCEYDWTVIPRMYNLDVETWKPKEIDDYYTARRRGKVHDYMCIGINEKNELRTLYYPKNENKVIHQSKADILIDDTMSCMGCCFFMHKDRFWELEGCDEGHGSWGQQGIEVACKAWLSGGSLKVNKKTWFAHWFRASDGGASYHLSGRAVDNARRYSKDLWLNNKWPLAKRSFKWLVDKFKPSVWDAEKMSLLINPNSEGDIIVDTQTKVKVKIKNKIKIKDKHGNVIRTIIKSDKEDGGVEDTPPPSPVSEKHETLLSDLQGRVQRDLAKAGFGGSVPVVQKPACNAETVRSSDMTVKELQFDAAYFDYLFNKMKHRYPRWRGHRIIKFPTDMILYHQVIWDTKPDIIVECGTAYGGSTLFLADMMNLLNKGLVISIDIAAQSQPKHELIAYINGSTVDIDVLNKVTDMIRPNDQVMVILDSDHSREHVTNELQCYAPIVTQGQYLVVEDAFYRSKKKGPGEAIDSFMGTDIGKQFKNEHLDRQFIMGLTRGGWLRKI